MTKAYEDTNSCVIAATRSGTSKQARPPGKLPIADSYPSQEVHLRRGDARELEAI
jgi:hypothetical protein